jgi:hypothetical protein
MIVHRFGGRLAWPPDALPLTPLGVDWHGETVVPPVAFGVGIDDERLWLVAARAAPASVLPGAAPGAFVPGLWRHDVAELFLGHLDDPAYLELNLAPNGAWWACELTAPRVPRHAHDAPIEGVRTHADAPRPAAWRAGLEIPIEALRARVRFDDRSTANVAFVLAGSDARYLSAAPPTAGPPDFHAPGLRRRLSIVR